MPPSFGLCFTAWEEELCGDNDWEFILGGIQNRFDIIDAEADPKPAHCENHKFAQPGAPCMPKHQSKFA